MGPKKTTVADASVPRVKLSTDFNKKVKAVNKIKKKYQRKTIGNRNEKNSASKESLKTAGYLDTKD